MRWVAVPVLAIALAARVAHAADASPSDQPAPRAAPTEADNPENQWDGGYDVKSKRRSDFTIGASLGALLGSAHGTPNEADAIDNPARVADTGVGFGSSFDLWLGGALRDWFTCAIGITGFGFERAGKQLGGGGFVFRLETFPFYGLGLELDDVGAFGSFGIGGAAIEADGKQVADGGAISFIALGAFWEPWRIGGFAVGPSLEYTHVFSQTLSMYAATAGVRAAFYAGP